MVGAISDYLNTPNKKEMGGPVKDGCPFDLFEEAEDSWYKWTPVITAVKKIHSSAKKEIEHNV